MSERMVRLPSTDLNIADDGTGTPVVFLHGWSYDLHLWDEVVPPVLDAGFRAIRVDQRGHGRSPVNGPYAFEALVDDLEELVDELALENPILCGLSLGGFVAMGHGIAHPGRARGLVLADTCSHPIARDSEMADTIPSTDQGRQALADWWEIGRTIPQEVAAHAAFDVQRERFADNSADGLKHAIEACARRSPVTESLSRITAPTLVIAGEHDQFFSPQMHVEMAAAIPGATFSAIPGAGHISCRDKPAVFTQLMLAFLGRITEGEA